MYIYIMHMNSGYSQGEQLASKGGRGTNAPSCPPLKETLIFMSKNSFIQIQLYWMQDLIMKKLTSAKEDMFSRLVLNNSMWESSLNRFKTE